MNGEKENGEKVEGERTPKYKELALLSLLSICKVFSESKQDKGKISKILDICKKFASDETISKQFLFI